jgi:hypothetical protein
MLFLLFVLAAALAVALSHAGNMYFAFALVLSWCCAQVDRATALTTRQGLRDHANFVKGDFMKQPFEDNTFDAIYQIEATAHAPDKVGCYKGARPHSTTSCGRVFGPNHTTAGSVDGRNLSRVEAGSAVRRIRMVPYRQV